MSGAHARLAAAELLMTVLEERRTLDDALASTQSFDTLSGPDRGFARAIVSAALRNLGRIDTALQPFLDRPLETAPPPSRALLRVGAAQAWILKTANHAVVGETVAASKLWPRAQRATGFLNAVLRKVVNDHSGFESTPDTALWPTWLRTIAIQGLGTRAAAALAAAQTRQPETYLTPKDFDAPGLAAQVDGKVVSDYSVQVETTSIESVSGFADGAWWVQDVAATLPVRLLDAQPNETVLDICAAPGGKTMQLAARGANVTAIDRSKPRLKRLKQNLWRTGLKDRVTVVQADATSWRPEAPVDKILLDAPCSALGTLRRHPEGAWIKTAEDVARFSDIQTRLLRASLEMLKPGGSLVYCVCSPLPHEGVDIVARGLSDSQIARLPVQADEVPGFEAAISADGDVLTLPTDAFGHDAFYVARLQRNA